ncbi:hypothetical protein Tco_1113597 [Tanacetum coccineum]|uniref:Uncharacterized protein n=1 Tax=Tanacetum coccineum TaxID=301880 RepID=A0ABQ5ISW9_9ASTR
MGLESLEARIVVHEKNEAVYEEDIAFLKYDVQVKDISIKDLKNQLEEALKEKDDLKLKLEKFEESSKNLTKLINSQISAKDKAGLGYDSQINKNEVVHSVFNSRESDVDDSPVNDRFKTALQERSINYYCQADNTAAPKSKVNDALPKTHSYFKAHSPVRRAFNQKSAPKTYNLNEKVKTTRVNNVTIVGPKSVVSAAMGNEEMLLSPQHAGFGDQQEMLLTIPLKTVDHTCLKDLNMLIYKADSSPDQGVVYSGCSRHMTGNKSFLTDYQEIDGGFVAFGGSPKGGKITGKVTAENQTNKNAGIKDNTQQYILLPLLYDSPKSSKDAVANHDGKKTNEEPANEGYANSINKDSTVSPSVSTDGQSFTNTNDLPTDPLMFDLEDTADLLNTGIFSGAYDDKDVGAEANINNLETTMNVRPIPTTRIHKDHPKDQIIGDINLATETRRMTKISEEVAMVSYIKK